MNTVGQKTEEQKTKKRFWRDYEPIEKMTLVMAIFAVIYSLITFGLLFIAMRQVDSMRKEQRPWAIAGAQIQPMPDKGTPLTILFNIANTGKTPAKSISAEFYIETVKNGEEARLANSVKIFDLTTGILYPGIGPNYPIQYDLLASQIEDYKAGRLFVVLYGTVVYTDVFKADHWSKFCGFYAGANGGFSAKKCTDYNDTDND